MDIPILNDKAIKQEEKEFLFMVWELYQDIRKYRTDIMCFCEFLKRVNLIILQYENWDDMSTDFEYSKEFDMPTKMFRLKEWLKKNP